MLCAWELLRREDHPYQRRCQDVRHRVVRTGLQLQERPEVMPQADPVGAQDGEDTRAVRTAHRRCHEQRHPYRHTRNGVDPTEDIIDDHARDDAGQQYTKGR